jgi:APA family basic amino acid/polyamine antiporter
MPAPGANAGLRRAIRLPHATALVVGTIIGASIFVQPSEITGAVQSIGGVLLVWLAAGALTMVGALIAAEWASAYPKTGGVYVYLSEAFGRPAGFLWGWAMFWSMHSGIIAAIAVIFARYTAYFVPLSPVGLDVVAIGAILLLSAVNYVGVKHGSMLQAAFTLGKLVAVAVIIVVGFVLGGRVPEHFVGAGAASGGVPLGGFLTAVAAGLFAFGGWHMVTYSAEETTDPARTIPTALVLGVTVVTASYIALNAVYLYVLPMTTVAASTRVAADAADVLLGAHGGVFMSALVMFSAFGALSGIVLAGPRVYYAMARDGLLFRAFGVVHPTFRTPHRAIALQGVWSSVLVATGTYRMLFTRVIYTEWIFFGLLAVGLVLLRRRGNAGTFAVPWVPVLPIVFALASAAVVLNQVIVNTTESITGLLMVAVGYPVYLLWARRRGARETQS